RQAQCPSGAQERAGRTLLRQVRRRRRIQSAGASSSLGVAATARAHSRTSSARDARVLRLARGRIQPHVTRNRHPRLQHLLDIRGPIELGASQTTDPRWWLSIFPAAKLRLALLLGVADTWATKAIRG